ncbi:MAG: phycobilisome rod-core linker polypeptide CpcG [Synechococcales cyanobacterium RM1_1_8]|nr:phycobilisome rod-core linker polypeptide CpcG [Synechococcales cyanobacterium RM1_1_8]
MAIPLLTYAPVTRNARVKGYEIAGDDQPRIYSAESLLSTSKMQELIEAAYRQIFFHAFKRDREIFLESQLRNGQITVRDFVRGLLLSETYRSSFYEKNSNYRFVEQTVQRALGRDVYGEDEKIAWSIVVATKGIQGFVDALLDSDEYLDNFGEDILPYQRRRSLPGRAEGEKPFNLQSPRYDEYHRNVLGFPKAVFTGGPASSFSSRQRRLGAGSPSYFLDMARSVSAGSRGAGAPALQGLDYMRKVPYRKVT